MQRFDLAGLSAVPWKNGGGTTVELACWPSGAAEFDWRVSVATIAAAGPFSNYAGVDRIIMLLDGAGVHLRSADAAIDHRLDTALEPFAFPGEAAIEGLPLGGESRDFNVMVRRGRCRAEVRVLRETARLAASRQGLLMAWSGEWQLHGCEVSPVTLAPGEGLWWADGALTVSAERLGERGHLIAVVLEDHRR